MKQTQQEKEIEMKMQPGVLTLKGFLGSDTRHIHDIIEEDERTLQKIGKSREELAERMRYFTNLAFETYDNSITVDMQFEVEYSSVRGKMVCPFPEPGTYQKGFILFRNIKKNIRLKWTPLSIHMIEKHGFFEGKGSESRLEPELLAEGLFT
jgi:hypothetical protein